MIKFIYILFFSFFYLLHTLYSQNIQNIGNNISANLNHTLSPSDHIQPHHNLKAAALLVYLSELKKSNSGNCLSGQAIGANGNVVNEKNNFQDYVVKLDQQTGHRPAVLEYGVTKLNGGQLTAAERETRLSEIKVRSNEGHLIYLGMRPSNPTGVPLNADITTPEFYINNSREIVEPDGKYYNTYRSTLEYISTFIQSLQDAGIVVLLEVFNEFNGQWNWFGNQTPEEFKKLYRYTHDYFNKERKFTNLIYVLEFSGIRTNVEGIPVSQYYPGDEYVDLIGFDFYEDDPQNKYVDVYNQILAFGKPVALTEFGPDNRKYKIDNKIELSKYVNFRWDNMVQVNFTKTYYPKICFFIRWQADWAVVNQNNAKSFMEESLWIHLDTYKNDSLALEALSVTQNNELKIIPNPTQGVLNIELHDREKATIIKILNIRGELVHKELINLQSNFHQIDLSFAPKGLYILKYANKAQKFVIH